jgi:hypothetical protein
LRLHLTSCAGPRISLWRSRLGRNSGLDTKERSVALPAIAKLSANFAPSRRYTLQGSLNGQQPRTYELRSILDRYSSRQNDSGILSTYAFPPVYRPSLISALSYICKPRLKML